MLRERDETNCLLTTFEQLPGQSAYRSVSHLLPAETEMKQIVFYKDHRKHAKHPKAVRIHVCWHHTMSRCLHIQTMMKIKNTQHWIPHPKNQNKVLCIPHLSIWSSIVRSGVLDLLQILATWFLRTWCNTYKHEDAWVCISIIAPLPKSKIDKQYIYIYIYLFTCIHFGLVP